MTLPPKTPYFRSHGTDYIASIGAPMPPRRTVSLGTSTPPRGKLLHSQGDADIAAAGAFTHKSWTMSPRAPNPPSTARSLYDVANLPRTSHVEDLRGSWIPSVQRAEDRLGAFDTQHLRMNAVGYSAPLRVMSTPSMRTKQSYIYFGEPHVPIRQKQVGM